MKKYLLIHTDNILVVNELSRVLGIGASRIGTPPQYVFITYKEEAVMLEVCVIRHLATDGNGRVVQPAWKQALLIEHETNEDGNLHIIGQEVIPNVIDWLSKVER